MSQHIVCLQRVDSSDSVRVMLGWDKPLEEFYLVIFEEPPVGQTYDEDRIVYSNLDDQRSVGEGLSYFKEVAMKLGCNVPDSMWRAAYQDREFNVVNKIVHYSPNGDVIERF